MKRNVLLILFFIFLLVACGPKKVDTKAQVEVAENFETSISIPIYENSWIWDKEKEGFETQRDSMITNHAVTLFDSQKSIKTYIHVKDTGNLHVGLHVKQVQGNPRLRISLGEQFADLPLDSTMSGEVLKTGTFRIKDPGYLQLNLEIKGKTNILIDELLVGGEATQGEVNFNKDNFHFGRRGPSVHLRYPIPEKSKKPIYFYNELEVPKGEDVIGSYFMADGFSHGYFGMQVNSEKERRVLFSVWSPYDTQDPKEIPEDQRIKLLNKGTDVKVGEFGNEGSGGQSYKKFDWKTGTTYKFLLRGEPGENDFTYYTAYFYAPEVGEWQLIAGFGRPQSGNYLGDFYSFLENFVPATGAVTRKGIYKNQWIYDEDEGWISLKKAMFTGDKTAQNKDRLDYAGGEADEGYFLKNCGFFDDNTPLHTEFERAVVSDSPDIDFKNLPQN